MPIEPEDFDDLIVVEQESTTTVVTEDTPLTAVVTDDISRVVVADGGQGPQGAQGPPGFGLTYISKTNNEVNTIPKCSAVYAFGSSGCKLASTLGAVQKDVLGFVVDDDGIQPAAVGSIQSGYVLAATIAEWNAVTDMVGGLSPGQRYFLADIPGHITPFYNDVTGYLCIVGQAISSTEMLVRIEPPIQF